jgi:hypothetical protein
MPISARRCFLAGFFLLLPVRAAWAQSALSSIANCLIAFADTGSAITSELVLFRADGSLAGAFALPEGSADCVGLVFLPPGAYVAQGTAAGADGEILTEVYILPFGS